MQIEYYNNKVQKIMTDAKLLKVKIGVPLGKILIKRINQLKASNNFNEYLEIGLGKPHPLKGNLDDCYGIWISGNYRIVAEPISDKLDMVSLKKCEKIKIRGVVDYHGGKYEWIIS